MNNNTPSTPSYLFGYWRPWKENSNMFDSYLDYTRDTSLAKYSADIVGNYMSEASREQTRALEQLGFAIGRGMSKLSNQMLDINQTLGFLNRNMSLQLEQQKLSNLLLKDIAELLRVPDSEKERQRSIELGVKFFVNASKDKDLFSDALDELLKAEELMKQDYFVLHRIGCIYLHVDKFINPELALDYFIKAAKYASVESDVNSARLVNALLTNFNTVNAEINVSEKQIGVLTSESYEKAAFAAYVLGRFEDAVNYQSKAVNFNDIAQNKFLLAKYQARNGNIDDAIENLNKAIDENPTLFEVVANLRELDLVGEPFLKLLEEKNKKIDNEIIQLIEKWKEINSEKTIEIISELNLLFNKTYDIKLTSHLEINEKRNEITSKIQEIIIQVDELKEKIKVTRFSTLNPNNLNSIIPELDAAKALNIEKMEEFFYQKMKLFSDKLNFENENRIEISKKMSLEASNKKLEDERIKKEKEDSKGILIIKSIIFPILMTLGCFVLAFILSMLGLNELPEFLATVVIPIFIGISLFMILFWIIFFLIREAYKSFLNQKKNK
jgi:tetratricopeptide (TPR) repeat protein